MRADCYQWNAFFVEKKASAVPNFAEKFCFDIMIFWRNVIWLHFTFEKQTINCLKNFCFSSLIAKTPKQVQQFVKALQKLVFYNIQLSVKFS